MNPTLTDCASNGAIAELVACAHLMGLGYNVFRSQSPASPFDLVRHKNGILERVEVKKLSSYKPRPSSKRYPNVNWPVNDEWDVLIVVNTVTGHCYEFTKEYNKNTAQAEVRAHHKETHFEF